MLSINVDGIRIPLPNTEKEMLRVANLWKRNAQAKLRRAKVNASGALKSSMTPKVEVDGDSIAVDITPDVDYWEFVDLGVRGSVSSPFPRQSESPFKYKSKMPPRKPLLDWIKVKPVTPRDKDGKFMKRETFAFLIQRAIFRRGIKPTFFISDTGDRIEAKYAQSIADALAEDIDNFLT